MLMQVLGLERLYYITNQTGRQPKPEAGNSVMNITGVAVAAFVM